MEMMHIFGCFLDELDTWFHEFEKAGLAKAFQVEIKYMHHPETPS